VPEPETPLAERPWEDVERMLGVDEALARVLAAFAPLPPVAVPILDALGSVLAETVRAEVAIPPFRNSAMDGYAVRAADTTGASADRPVRLPVVANLPAGPASPLRLRPGAAARIMTGAAMPEGADAVVRFEETDEGGGRQPSPPEGFPTVGVFRPARVGDNAREAGEDVRAGDPVLVAGTRLRPAEVGLLAALNRSTVLVHRRPRVAILSTGDEVVEVGPALAPGQIRNSNGAMLAAMCLRFGATPLPLGIARDTVDDLSAKLAAAGDADLLVTSGGVSLGDFDVVKDVLRAEGEVAIWQVRMKPGKPLAFGHVGGRPLLGLPGNPVAAAVSFELFGRPAILTLLGRRDLAPPTVEATVTERIDNRGQRRHYVRVVVGRGSSGDLVARTAGEQGAGVLSSLTRANGLLVVPEQLAVAERGMRLPVLLLDADGPPIGEAGG
jgi:molybdopterin molybdotransferase